MAGESGGVASEQFPRVRMSNFLLELDRLMLRFFDHAVILGKPLGPSGISPIGAAAQFLRISMSMSDHRACGGKALCFVSN